MIKKIDLHIHSNLSEDADLAVDEIFDLAERSSLSAISITDHDSVESIGKAKKISGKYSVEYVPGVEISTVFPIDKSQQHILGYFVNNTNKELIECLKKISGYRKVIEKQRTEALRNLGFSLDETNIRRMTGNRPSTAVAIMNELFTNKNNINDRRLHVYLHGEKKERRLYYFYKDYFTKQGPAYVQFQSISAQEGIDIINKAGGIPILAHPIMLEKKEYLDIIKEMGIAGIEAVSTYHNQKDIEFYLEYAEKNSLLATAGSDFHGPTAKPHIKLGSQEGMNYMYLEKLKNSLKK